jgi:Zn-dependent peptidase ImmA (M78 family)
MTPSSPIDILNAFQRTVEAPVNVERLARDLGLLVIRENLQSDFAGMIIRDRKRPAPSGYTVYINARDNPKRQRFTLAHEIAHYILHRDLIGDGITDDALYRSSLGEWYERQANRMAADILMPAKLVKAYYRRGNVAIAPLAKQFDVSPDAMRIRFEELKLGP